MSYRKPVPTYIPPLGPPPPLGIDAQSDAPQSRTRSAHVTLPDDPEDEPTVSAPAPQCKAIRGCSSSQRVAELDDAARKLSDYRTPLARLPWPPAAPVPLAPVRAQWHLVCELLLTPSGLRRGAPREIQPFGTPSRIPHRKFQHIAS
jgi:hypothetical protein